MSEVTVNAIVTLSVFVIQSVRISESVSPCVSGIQPMPQAAIAPLCQIAQYSVGPGPMPFTLWI